MMQETGPTVYEVTVYEVLIIALIVWIRFCVFCRLLLIKLSYSYVLHKWHTLSQLVPPAF